MVGSAEVVVTFLTMKATGETAEVLAELLAASITENALPLDDFGPTAPAKPIRLSDLVLKDRRNPPTTGAPPMCPPCAATSLHRWDRDGMPRLDAT